jgi:type I restriction enzyme S subunit
VEDHEKYFLLPPNWEWVRLGSIQEFTNGYAFKSSQFTEFGVGVIRIGDVSKDGKVTPKDMRYLPVAIAEDVPPQFFVHPQDLVITMTGDVKPGINDTKESFLLNQRVGKLTPYLVSRQFLFIYLTTVAQQKIDNAFGGVIPNVSTREINESVMGLPPLEEQHRIVQKVDELMALCDRLEQQTSDQLEAHETLVDTLLGTLTQSENAAELADNWARLAAHFDTLFTTEQSIDKLKQTILQLAVMGRLVEQDAGDESASVLLGKLNDRRVQVLADKKTRVAGKINPVTSENQPFHLPTGWAWCRFEQLIDPRFSISYGVLVPGADATDGVPLIRVADLSLSPQQSLPEKRISPDVDVKHAKTRLVGGEILLCVVGSIGKIGIAPRSWEGANIARAICRLMPSPLISKEFLLLLLQTDFMQEKFGADTRTLAQPTLNVGLIKVAETPLPPISEQHRIVQKVDELMALCDQLKERLNQASETRNQLAEAVVEGTLN